MSDDLTRIAGIGQATAARLAQAGITGFAALAAADPAALAGHEALRGVRASPADIPAWIAAAAELAGGQNTRAKESPEGVVIPADRAEAQHAPGGEQPGTPAGVTTPAGPLAPDLPRGPCLVITATAPGHRRAGRRFGPVPHRIALADLGADALAALEADPRLSIIRTGA